MNVLLKSVTITTEKGSVVISSHVLDAIIMIATDHVHESGESYNVTLDDVTTEGNKILDLLWDIEEEHYV